MARKIISGHGFFKSRHPMIGRHMRAQQGLASGKGLVCIDQKAKVIPNRRAHSNQPCGILQQMRFADFNLGHGKANGLDRQGILDQGLRCNAAVSQVLPRPPSATKAGLRAATKVASGPCAIFND